MTSVQNQHRAPWAESVMMTPTTPMTQNMVTDVCVVGAGITGLTTAYCLLQEGLNVVVLEAEQIGNGETGRTTAHLTHAMDDRFVVLEKIHGPSKTRLIAESHTSAITRVEDIVHQEGIDCDFLRLDGYLFLPPNERIELLHRELAASHRAGLRATAMVSRAPLDGFNSGPAIIFPNQAQLQPLKYLAGLSRAVIERGGKVFTGTRVTEVHGGKSASVRTANGQSVHAKYLVIATNAPIVSRVAIASRQSGYRTYVIAARVPSGSVHQALYWDTAIPYHYVRVQPQAGHDLLIIGGEDHKTGQEENPEARWKLLERWADARFPTIHSIEFRWSGQVMETMDYAAFIGPNPLDEPNVYIATGDSGQGMTHGTIAGMLLTDLIRERPNPWAEVYDPSRMSLAAIGRFAFETLNSVAQYGDWVTAGDVETAKRIPPDSGAVVRRGFRKVAVYRDTQGTLHEHSAVCPHLGCVVHWNKGEKTWDCPCHGSRFSRDGVVLNGPAASDLVAIDEEASKESA